MQSDLPQPNNAVLRCTHLSKRYMQGGWLSKNRREVQALKDVTLSIRAGSTLALIGESGSGKSTLARCLTCLERPDSGEVWFAGRNVAALPHRELVAFQRQVQIVFQEPAASLNPRLNAMEIVSEPLLIAGESKKKRHERALYLMHLVGLPDDSQKRLPSEFSGGQRRRLAIARALALEPSILILDESLSGLDPSIQAQISNLLTGLQDTYHLTYICISHDLDLVAHLADEIAVLHQGQIVEIVPASMGLADLQDKFIGRLQRAARASSFGAGLP
jgi:peptide/nickel transport system ATP-binding protein/oligopeptide transport system ATP-binding protein